MSFRPIQPRFFGKDRDFILPGSLPLRAKSILLEVNDDSPELLTAAWNPTTKP
jgi:hypothetical protein